MEEPTPREAYLLRLLNHARGCDGIRCETCNDIDRGLQDGKHYMDDPLARFELVEEALVRLHTQAEELFSALESAPVPAATRRAAIQLGQWAEKTIRLLREPVTVGSSDHVPAPRTAAGGGPPGPGKGRAAPATAPLAARKAIPRTAVVVALADHRPAARPAALPPAAAPGQPHGGAGAPASSK